MDFVGALVVFFLLMVWVGLGSVVVVFGWVISVAIVLRVRRYSWAEEGATRFSKSSKPSLIFLDQRDSRAFSIHKGRQVLGQI